MKQNKTSTADAKTGIDFSAVLTDFDGKPMRHGTDEKKSDTGAPLTLGFVCKWACHLNLPTDQQMPVETRLKMVGLGDDVGSAAKINGPVPITSGEITLLCERVNEVWPNLVVYRAIELLDPARIKRRDAA